MSPHPGEVSLMKLRETESFEVIKANVEHEIVGLLKKKLQQRTVRVALETCKNIDNDLNSRLEASKIVLNNIASNKNCLNDIVESDLRCIVSQSCDNEADSNKLFLVKARAFQCLNSVSEDVPNYFYDDYYRHVRARLIEEWKSLGDSVIKKLDQYIESCSRINKFRLLKVLSMFLTEGTCPIDLSVFHDQSSEWCKELLISYLLSINDTWDVNQTLELVSQINDLHGFMVENSSRRSIEDVLEVLIDNENKCRLDVEFIMNALTLLRSDIRSLDILFRDDCFLPLVIDELETLRLRGKCEKRQIRYNDEKEFAELLNLLVFSDETVDHVFEKIPLNTHITELIEFFTLLKNTDWPSEQKSTFLLQSGIFSGIDNWKVVLFRRIIGEMIQREFPHYNPHLTHQCHYTCDDKDYFSSVEIKDEKKCTRYNEVCDAGKSELRAHLTRPENSKDSYLLKDLNSKLAAFLPFTNETIDLIKKYVECLDSVEKIAQLNNSLDILIEYEIDSKTWETYAAIISTSDATNVRSNVHDCVIEKIFPGTYEKPLDELIEELVSTNEREVTLLEKRETLRKAYGDVMNAYNGKSFLFPTEEPIKDWNETRIKEMVVIIKAIHMTEKFEKKDDEYPNQWRQIFSVISNSSVLTRKHILGSIIEHVTKNAGFCVDNQALLTRAQSAIGNFNDVQLHNELIAVIKRTVEITSKMKVRDIQLLSMIMMLNSEKNKGRLAQINTGEGKTIIIAMIAAYHATRGRKVDVITSSPLLAIPQSKQYKHFFSKLDVSVGHNINNSTGYKYDVLYGTAHEFQADILREEFRGRKIRHGRKFDIAIVDEVDNMLIDGNNYIVLLSADMPAMGHLETLLAAIYAQVNTTARSIVVKNGQSYFLQQENAFDENGNVKADVIVREIPISGTKREFIQKSTELHIRSLIRDCDTSKLSENFPEIKIPNHLRDFVCKVQLTRWIERAIWAKFSYVKDEDYVLDEGKIKIVDAKDTGVVKHNSHWSNGLHQFLEIKHGAKINPESLTSNYISNVTFFRRYRPNIYGLTGTLGSNGTKELLCKTYDVDTIVVPPFKLKQHRQLAAIVVYNESNWYTEIAKSCLRKLKNGRAVLIIMEYIRQTADLEKIFKERFGYDSSLIKLYKTDAHSSVVEEPLKSGEVIITTNIAGRGTDVKLSKGIDDNGGLHVCVTFLPKNSRVELQNTGRTARTGNRGTSQFVLHGERGTTIDDMRKSRADREKNAMKKADKDIQKVMTGDTIFQRFSELMRLINGRNDDTRKIELTAVEERFAIWKETHDKDMGDEKKVLEAFENFRKDILSDDSRGKLIKNAYMHVQIGNKYLEDKRYTDAIAEYRLAKDLDPNFAENALYNRGYATIAAYGNDMAGNKPLIDRAVDDFKKARALIEERESCLHLLQNASDGKVFSDHVTHKLNLYNVQKNAIDMAIGPDLDAIKSQIKELHKLKESGKLTTEEQKKEYSERMDHLNNDKKRKGVIEEARSKGLDIEIEGVKLENYLPDDDLQSHAHEIKEFERNGYIGGFKVSTIPPIDWSAVIGLLALGFGQLIIGAALTVFTLGAGASFGMGLIAEGISDIITAVKDGIINRTFSWVTWAIEKAISVAVSVACAGFSAMKDVAKTAYAGAKTAASIGNKVLTETVKGGWKIVAKKVGFELAKGVGKQIANSLIDYGIDKTLVPAIQKEIVKSLEGPFRKALTNNRYVKIMLELDQKNNNRFYEELIMQCGYKLLDPEENSKLKYMATQIAHRVAQNKSSMYSKVSQVWSLGSALYDLATFSSDFIEKLEKSIREAAEKHKIDKITDVNDTSQIADKRNEETARSSTQNKPKSTDGDIDLDRLNDEDEKVVLEKKPRTPRRISNDLVNAASMSMLGIIKSKIIAPVVQKGVNFTMDSITSSIDASLHNETENFRAHKRIIHEQNKGYGETKKPKREETFTETETHDIRKVDELIEDARSGKPSGLPHLGAISDATDRPIEVYNVEGKLKYIIGDSKKGEPVKIQYHQPKDGENTGHYTLTGSREPSTKGNSKNMCLYNVIAAQTGHNPKNLKNRSLRIMEENKVKMSNQAKDIMRLERYSGIKLAMGGARYSGKNADDAGKLRRDCDGKSGFNYPNPGHTNEHASFQGDPDEHLKALSQESKRIIHVYDDNGNLIKTIDERPKVMKGNKEKKLCDGPPMKWVHHRPPGDATDEYLTPLNGDGQKYRFHDPTNSYFYEKAGKITKQDPDVLEKKTSKIMDNKSRNKPCVESYARKSPPKTGYLSTAELNLVLHHALETKSCKDGMAELNKYKKGVRDGAQYTKQVKHIKAKELNLPKKVYGAQWNGHGEIAKVFLVQDVTIVMYHQKGQENNPNAQVHVQTIFPREPPSSYNLIGKWDISPTDL